MGKRLAKHSSQPELIKLSTSERTRETMRLLLEESGWKNVNVVEKEWLYLASPQEYIKSVEKLDDSLKDVWYCGHNPTITSVINYFAGEKISNVPTCGLAVIEFDVDSWAHVSKDSGKLTYYDYPKKEA